MSWSREQQQQDLKAKQEADSKAAACRAYKDLKGLRQLQADQKDISYYGTGCGWIYKPGGGIFPQISQGAYGNAQGPFIDTMEPGAKWIWDLPAGEKEISRQACGNLNRCSQLKILGNYAEICGFCKSSGHGIPINKGAAKYPSDPLLQCDKGNIVSVFGGACPAEEGFAPASRLGLQPERSEGFAPASRLGLQPERSEGFANANINSLASCTSPLTRDCVLLAAREAGCSDSGSLAVALSGAADPKADYDKGLQANKAYQAYSKNITPAVLKDGSTSIQVAIDDFRKMVQTGATATGTTESQRLRLAARDLCLKAGEFDSYDFCSELRPTSLIDATNIECIQRRFKEDGGTEKGTAYPTARTWSSKTIQAFTDFMFDLNNRIQSTDKQTNAKALLDKYGVDSRVPKGELGTEDNLRGTETIWFDLVDSFNPASIPIVLRHDLMFESGGNVLPRFSSAQELAQKYNVPSAGQNIAFFNAYEMRPAEPKGMDVKFKVVVDDGFVIGQNQNPFENAGGLDWGSWLFQGPMAYESGVYKVGGKAANQKDTFITKYFNGPGGGMFLMDVNGQNPNEAPALRKNFYLTQEPLAPWLQYEPCSKKGKVAFQERRWYGPAGLVYNKDPRKYGELPGFDSVSNAGVTIRPEYMSLTTSAWWHTKSYFGFTSLKTLTLLVRPTGQASDGGSLSVFHHVNFSGLSLGFYLTRRGGQHFFTFWDGLANSWKEPVPCVMNEWNFVVIQYLGNYDGLRAVTFDSVRHADLLERDGAKLRSFLTRLKNKAAALDGGSVKIGSPAANRANAGYLILGGTSPDYKDKAGEQSWKMQSFEGDIGYIHGFRNFFDKEELLVKEVSRSWLSRWPVSAF